MSIKCFEKYIALKTLFDNGYKRDINFFCERIEISNRTFHRFIKYLRIINSYSIKYDKHSGSYYLD